MYRDLTDVFCCWSLFWSVWAFLITAEMKMWSEINRSVWAVVKQETQSISVWSEKQSRSSKLHQRLVCVSVISVLSSFRVSDWTESQKMFLSIPWCSVCFCLNFTVLKLLKMATGMRALLDTVVQALPQVNTHTHKQISVSAQQFSPKVVENHEKRLMCEWSVRRPLIMSFQESLSVQHGYERLSCATRDSFHTHAHIKQMASFYKPPFAGVTALMITLQSCKCVNSNLIHVI